VTRRERVEALILVAVLAASVGAGLALTHRSTNPKPTIVDSDKQSDCWSHPDPHGRRHCDTRPDR